MALPLLPDEQRAANLEKAVQVRRERAGIKDRIKTGAISLPDVLEEGTRNEVIAKTKVAELIEAVPGVGKVRRIQIMERLGISVDRRVKGLGPNQRGALEAEFAELVPA